MPLRRKELAQNRGVGVCRLDAGDVPGATDQPELRAGDQLGGLAHQVGRGRAVLGARDAERSAELSNELTATAQAQVNLVERFNRR